MTYDRQVQGVTYRQAMQDLRDKVSGLSGWSVLDDSEADPDNYFVLRAPDGTEQDIYIGFVQPSNSPQNDWNDLRIGYGSGWDGNGGFDHGISWAGTTQINSNNRMNTTDDVEYWLEYVGDGFVFYLRRVQGDGHDSCFVIGLEEFNEYWNHGGADSDPDTNPWEYGAVASIGSPESGNNTQGVFPSHFEATGRFRQEGGIGMLNPDPNFSNYVYQIATWQASYVENADTGASPRFGTTRLWLQDQSGSDLNTGDVVQDSEGVDVYEIVDYFDRRYAIRMD